LVSRGRPVRILQFDADLEKLREKIAKGPFLEQKIQEYFIDNTHRVLFKLAPDQEKEEKENQKLDAELKSILDSLSEQDIEKIKQDAEALKKLQETPEDLSVLPTLELSEIPPEVQKVKESAETNSAMLYQQPTSGIFYLASAAGVGNLNQDLISLAFFLLCFTQIRCQKQGLHRSRKTNRPLHRWNQPFSQARTGYGDHGLEGPGPVYPLSHSMENAWCEISEKCSKLSKNS
jgi:presequence protease